MVPHRSPFAEWRALKWLLAATVVLIYASYWFVMEPPQAHAFYVLAPIGLLFAAYCWTFVDSPRWRSVAAALLALNVVLQVGLAWLQAPERSLYQNREVVAAAVRLKQPRDLRTPSSVRDRRRADPPAGFVAAVSRSPRRRIPGSRG